MNKKKLLSAFLAVALVMGLAIPGAWAADSDQETKNALTINKTAVANNDGSYTITLEAYATGEKMITQTNKDVPTDIVLVLDQSGSMGYCINCGTKYKNGEWQSNSCVKYESVGTVANTAYTRDTTYYYYSNSGYLMARYCSDNQDWHQGHSGWYEHSAYRTHGNKLNNNVTLYKKVSGGEHEHRLDSLKNALTAFCKSVQEKATTAANHKIAIVGFSSSGYSNTELLTGVDLSNGNKVTSGQYYYYPTTTGINGEQYGPDGKGISDDQYKAALQDMSTTAGVGSVENAIGALTASGGTYTDDGLTMAEKIFSTYTITTDKDGNPTRNRVVVLFTDGDTDDGRKDTINTAYALKNTYGATVYTVGIFDGANGTPVTSWDNVSNTNRFMHLISSNFKNAQVGDYSQWTDIRASTNTNPANGSSYYLSASDTTSLNNIFKQIAGNINTDSTVTELNENTVIKDVVAQQFTMPEEAADISVYTEESNGSTTNWKNREEFAGAEIEIDSETRSISVSNFSFKDNWCGNSENLGESSFHDGKKLIIEFTVSPKDGFLGGNEVYTNTSAGVYENAAATEPVQEFNRPQVNVPIEDVTVTAADKNVYLLGSLTAEQIKSDAIVKCGDVSLTLGADDYGLESWQTEYVDIEVTYTDKDGKAVTNLSDLKDDTTYTVEATVSPKTDSSTTTEDTVATKKSGTATGKVNVFKPELTFKDSEVYYGDTAPESYGNLTKTEWKHGDTLSTDDNVEMLGTAPTLDLTYTPDSTKIKDGKINSKDDIAVDVTVKIGENDVTTSTSFKHTSCTDRTETLPADKEFLLHVKTCSLTIKKAAGDNTTIGSDEYFVFNVKKDGAAYTQVVIKGTDSVTLSELPVGSYTVEEDSSTAWRYTSSMNPTSATLSKSNTSGTITCTNTKSNNHWLDGSTAAVNEWKDGELKRTDSNANN